MTRLSARALAELVATLRGDVPRDRDVIRAGAALARLREGRVPFDRRSLAPERAVLPEGADATLGEMRWYDGLAVALRADPFFGEIARHVAEGVERDLFESKGRPKPLREAARLLDDIARRHGFERENWQRRLPMDEEHQSFLGVERELAEWFAAFDVAGEARRTARERRLAEARRARARAAESRRVAKARAEAERARARRRARLAEQAAWTLVASWRDRDRCREIAACMDRKTRERALEIVESNARPIVRAAIRRLFEQVEPAGTGRLDESIVMFAGPPPELGVPPVPRTVSASAVPDAGEVPPADATPHPVPEAEPEELPDRDSPAQRTDIGTTRFDGVVRDTKALLDAVRGRLGESYALYVKNLIAGAPFEAYDRNDLVAIRDVAADLGEKDFALALDDWIAAQEVRRTAVLRDPSSEEAGDVFAHPVKVREPDVLLALARRRYGSDVAETLGRLISGEREDLSHGHLEVLADLARERAEPELARRIGDILGREIDAVQEQPTAVTDVEDFAAVAAERWGEEAAETARAWASGDDSVPQPERARLRLLADRIGFARPEDTP